MSKFCGQCGAQLNDDATFCTNCGANLGQPAQQTNANQSVNTDAIKNAAATAQAKVSQGYDAAKNTVTTAVKKGDKKTLAVVGGIVVLAVVLVIILLCLIFGGGYKTPLKKMVKAYTDGDGKAYRQMTVSDKMYKAMAEEDDDVDDDYDKYGEEAQESLENKYGDNVKVSYSVKSKTALKKTLLESKQTQLELKADRKDLDYEPKVTKGYKLKVEIKIKGSDDDDKSTSTLYVYKVDGDWIMEDPALSLMSLISSSDASDLSDLGDLFS